MKNMLIATDFSPPAENAAHYAIGLAKKLKTNIILCNAYLLPSDMPLAAQVAWPLVDEADLEAESEDKLSGLVKKLENTNCDATDYCPQITFESEKGSVREVVAEMVKRKKTDLVVMGMAGAGQLIQWALGSNSKEMIDNADFPVLYVPFVAKFRPIKKIGFTTDLSTDDLKPLEFLCHMAKTMDSEIIVYHIAGFEQQRVDEETGRSLDFFKKVVSKIDYKKIRFEHIAHSHVDEGFRYIRNNSELDMLAMVHHQHRLLDKLINGSYAHKLSRFTKIPLLVFQPSEKIYK